MRPVLIVFFVIALLCKLCASDLEFSITSYNKPSMQRNEIVEIFEKASGAIKHLDQTRIYLDTSRLHVSDDGIFLKGDRGEWISLPFLFSSRGGLYLEAAECSVFGV